MSQSPSEMYPGAVVIDPAFIDGKYKDSSDPAILDGTPVDQARPNQNLALQDAMMNNAGLAYDGVIDTPATSQLFKAMMSSVGNGVNHIQNHNFSIATTEDSQPRPDATPRSYAPDYQVFAGWYADPGVGVTNLTYDGGVINFTAGALYQDVDLEFATGLISSVAGLNGIPTDVGVSFSPVSGKYRVLISSASGDVFSVKFEQNPYPTRHQPYGSVADFIDPIGTLKWYAGDTPPIGYLEVRLRADLSPWPKLEALLPGGIPETRGEFLRVWDNGRGVDTGRAILSYQDQDVQPLDLNLGDGIGVQKGIDTASFNSVDDLGSVSATPSINSGDETRPRNIAFMLIIRAA